MEEKCLYPTMMFDESDIDSLKVELLADRKGEFLTVEDLRQYMHISCVVISNGLIKDFSKGQVLNQGKKNLRVVHISALQVFETKYIAATAMAKQIGKSSNAVIAYLRRQGIKPVSGEDYRGDRYLYRRKDVMSVFDEIVKAV